MQLILILALILALVVGGVFLVEAWNGQQDAQAQRLAAEANRVRAEGEAAAAKTRASAEAASIRSDATGRMLATMFPYLILAALAGLAMFVGFPILTAYLERARNVPAQTADLLALAALGRMWLSLPQQQNRDALKILARVEQQKIEA